MKILAFIPLPYCAEGQFWQRDLGLVVLALRKLGHEAFFVALGATHKDQQNHPLLLVDDRNAVDPAWWSAQHADMIIINTWSATRHQRIRSATLSTGALVVEKLDTDGVKSPKIYPFHSIRRNWVRHDLDSSCLFKMQAWTKALTRFLLTYLFPALLDKRMIRGMESVAVYVAETPIACARVRRFLRMYQANPMPRVMTIPHPVQTDDMMLPEGTLKENVVISIGRWNDAVKGWPLLRDEARLFLRSNPDWIIKVVGNGAEAEGRRLCEEFPGRFFMLGRLEHAEMKFHLRQSKIYLLTSHSETFNIAGAEALCCGCSVVGPAQIPSSAFFASHASGTVSYIRTPAHLADALDAEANEWRSGARCGMDISKAWNNIVGKDAIAERYIAVFDSYKRQQ